jgi:hypothetical protein
VKRLLILLVLGCYFHSGNLEAQITTKGIIPSGTFQVGYDDAIIFNNEVNYKAFGYQGKAPLFVHIWYPLEKTIERAQYMEYGDFRQNNVHDDLKKVYSLLNESIDSSCIVYNISETYGTYDPITYGDKTYREVLQAEKNTLTESIRKPLKEKLNYPVILYHHGSQGLPDENFAMAEYFASRGYIFVSANFHLPYPGRDYGSSIFYFDPYSFPKVLASYAESISSNGNLFYIGHSWGAQIGLVNLAQSNSIDAFVSMETTMEMKTDTVEIKDKWADIYKTFRRKKLKISVPTLMFGNNGSDQIFPFFQDISKSTMIHASTKEDFGHESYTSAYWLRYLHRALFPQPDEVIIERQIALYIQHLKLIEAFFSETQKGKKPELTDFNSDFYIHIIQP